MFCNYIVCNKGVVAPSIFGFVFFFKIFPCFGKSSYGAYIGEGQGQGTRIRTIGWAKIHTKWGFSTPCIGGIGGSK